AESPGGAQLHTDGFTLRQTCGATAQDRFRAALRNCVGPIRQRYDFNPHRLRDLLRPGFEWNVRTEHWHEPAIPGDLHTELYAARSARAARRQRHRKLNRQYS